MRSGGKSGHKKSGNSDNSDPSDHSDSDSDHSDSDHSDKSDLSDHSDSDLSDSDKSNSDRPPTGRSFDELMALYDLNLLDNGQCKTSSSRYTPTGVLLGSWHHKMHPAARDELHASVIHPGPMAMKGLAVYKAALRAALQPAACTSSMLILHSLSRGNDTLRDHTDNLTAIACASKHMKQLRRTIKSVREEGDYDTDLIPSGAITGSKSFWRFDPLQCDRASQWWDALLELHEAYWGSPAALSCDDTKAESAWLATNLGGIFEQGDSSASDLVSAEGVNYKRRETAEQDRNFCTLAFRRKNLLAASRDDLVKKFLDHLQLRELELHKLSWGKFTREFKLTDKGTQQRAKIEQQLSSPSQSTIPNLHKTPAPTAIIEPRFVSFADAIPRAQDPCWSHLHLMDGCSYGSKCKHRHDGLQGSRMYLLANEKGACLKFIDGKCDRGIRCKFSHDKFSPSDTRRQPPTQVYTVQGSEEWAEDWGDDVLEAQIWSVQVN